MSLLDIKHFTKTPVGKLKNLNIGDEIELLTFKKDRKIIIIKKADHTYDVVEDGFEMKEFPEIADSKLEKILTQLQRIEFPRSHKFFMEIFPSPKNEEYSKNKRH